jgi:hypothetical protein
MWLLLPQSLGGRAASGEQGRHWLLSGKATLRVYTCDYTVWKFFVHTWFLLLYVRALLLLSKFWGWKNPRVWAAKILGNDKTVLQMIELGVGWDILIMDSIVSGLMLAGPLFPPKDPVVVLWVFWQSSWCCLQESIHYQATFASYSSKTLYVTTPPNLCQSGVLCRKSITRSDGQSENHMHGWLKPYSFHRFVHKFQKGWTKPDSQIFKNERVVKLSASYSDSHLHAKTGVSHGPRNLKHRLCSESYVWHNWLTANASSPTLHGFAPAFEPDLVAGQCNRTSRTTTTQVGKRAIRSLTPQKKGFLQGHSFFSYCDACLSTYPSCLFPVRLLLGHL